MSIDFLIRMLAHHDGRAEAAALALGGARAGEATEALVAWCRESRPEPRRRVGYLALALLRDDAANAYLVEVMRGGARSDAVAAAGALATFAELLEAPVRREIDALLAT